MVRQYTRVHFLKIDTKLTTIRNQNTFKMKLGFFLLFVFLCFVKAENKTESGKILVTEISKDVVKGMTWFGFLIGIGTVVFVVCQFFWLDYKVKSTFVIQKEYNGIRK